MTAALTEPAAVVSALAEARVVAVLRGPDAERTVQGVDALVAGGVTAIEVTYTTPDATEVIAEVRARHGDAVLLGAGTVVEAAQAEAAVAAGASFLVTPGTRPALAEAMLATGAAVLLGALSPSEVMQAVELGAAAVKVFPAALGGPAYLKALRGPFPDVALMPTGGVSAGNVAEWFAAGAFAVGAGGDLCGAAHLAQGRWDAITANARQFHDAAEVGA